MGASVIAILVAFPRPGDAAFADALARLERFAARFEAEARRQQMEQEAVAKARLPLSTVAEQTSLEGVLALTATSEAPAIEPRAQVALRTLADVQRLAQPNTRVETVRPSSRDIASALRWRLLRMGGGDGWVLREVSWKPASIEAAAIEREQGVEPARERLRKARRALQRAQRRFEKTEKVLEYRRKRGLAWKHVKKAIDARNEAGKALVEAREAVEEAKQHYDTLTEEGGRFAAPDQAMPLSQATGAAVTATLKRPDGEALEADLPASLEREPVAVTPVRTPDFAAARQAGLWDELRQQAPAAAIETVRSRLSWHHAGGNIGPLRVGGPTLLQLLPLLLAPFYWLLGRRCQAARERYSPFEAQRQSLPRVGLGAQVLDHAVLAGPAVAVMLLGTWTLFRIHALWPIPLFLGPLSVVAAVWSGHRVTDLRDLGEDIQRTSLPPAPR